MKMDPRITAYAVGELESREREIFESELSASSTLQNEVAAIALLADQLAAGPRKHERFDPEIRAWLLDRCLDNQKSRLRAKRTIVWTGLGLAASLVAYIGFDWIKPEQKPWQQPFRSCGLPEEPAFQSQAAPEAAAASDHAHYPGVQSVVDLHLQALEFMKFKAGQKLAGQKIQVAFFGSCTNARVSDFVEASKFLKGRKVAKGIRAIAVPGSQGVSKICTEMGIDKIFREAGFDWREAGCSMCLGMNPDQLVGDEICASSSNRNFKGRQGSPTGRTLLMSPVMVAAAAVTGEVSDARKVFAQN